MINEILNHVQVYGFRISVSRKISSLSLCASRSRSRNKVLKIWEPQNWDPHWNGFAVLWRRIPLPRRVEVGRLFRFSLKQSLSVRERCCCYCCSCSNSLCKRLQEEWALGKFRFRLPFFGTLFWCFDFSTADKTKEAQKLTGFTAIGGKTCRLIGAFEALGLKLQQADLLPFQFCEISLQFYFSFFPSDWTLKCTICLFLSAHLLKK